MSEQNDDAFDQLADDIADALFNQGRITLDNILPSDITTALLNKAIGLGDSQWQAGGIGRGNQHQQAYLIQRVTMPTISQVISTRSISMHSRAEVTEY